MRAWKYFAASIAESVSRKAFFFFFLFFFLADPSILLVLDYHQRDGISTTTTTATTTTNGALLVERKQISFQRSATIQSHDFESPLLRITTTETELAGGMTGELGKPLEQGSFSIFTGK